MRRVLVTAISGDIGNAVLKILRNREGHVLYGCDVNEIAAGMDLVHRFWKSKYAKEPGYTDELLEKCLAYGITHLIPVNEKEIAQISQERHRFEEKHIKLVMQDTEILKVCLDKWRTAEKLQALGFRVPKTYLKLQQAPCGHTYICKPRKSNGSNGIWLLTDQERDRVIPADYLIQEYIDSSEEFTIGVFRQDSIVNVVAFRRVLKHGYSFLVELDQNDMCRRLAADIAVKLDLKGYLNLQLRRKDDRYYIFEINPRISGTVRFRHMIGFTDVLWWLDLLDGKQVPAYECPYHKAVGIKELNEKYLVLE